MLVDKVTADIICRALLAIVAALRKQYNLPQYKDIVLVIAEREDKVTQ